MTQMELWHTSAKRHKEHLSINSSLKLDHSGPTCFPSFLLVGSMELCVNTLITDVGYNNNNAKSWAQTSGHFLLAIFFDFDCFQCVTEGQRQ